MRKGSAEAPVVPPGRKASDAKKDVIPPRKESKVGDIIKEGVEKGGAELELEVLEARSLAAADSNGFSDPYCVILYGSSKCSTKVKKKTLDPIWNESFAFPFSKNADKMLIQVFDKDRMGSDGLGQAEVSLKSVGAVPLDQWLQLQPSKSKEKVSGDLHIRIRILQPFQYEKNIAVVLKSVGVLQVEPREVPLDVPPQHVIVRVRCVGIAGDDISYLEKGAHGSVKVLKPVILGHEFSGQVVSVGEGVTTLREGDRVAVEPTMPCLRCNRCKSAKFNFCENVHMFGTPPQDGAMSTCIIVPDDICYTLPSLVSYEEAALVDLLSYGVHACRRAGVSGGNLVVVFGCSALGVATMLAAEAFGASRVAMVDTSPARVAYANDRTRTGDPILWGPGETDESMAGTVKRTFSSACDIAFVCEATEPMARAAVYCSRAGGVVCFVGQPAKEIVFPMLDASVRDVEIRCAFRYRNTYPACLELVANGRIPLRSLITHRFRLDEAPKAFETAALAERIEAKAYTKVILTA